MDKRARDVLREITPWNTGIKTLLTSSLTRCEHAATCRTSCQSNRECVPLSCLESSSNSSDVFQPLLATMESQHQQSLAWASVYATCIQMERKKKPITEKSGWNLDYESNSSLWCITVSLSASPLFCVLTLNVFKILVSCHHHKRTLFTVNCEQCPLSGENTATVGSERSVPL